MRTISLESFDVDADRWKSRQFLIFVIFVSIGRISARSVGHM